MPTTNFTVASESDLNTAIRDIDANGTQSASNTAYTITISPNANMVLSSRLLAINLDSGSSLTIIGNTNTLNGQGSQRGLFVYAGSVTVENLTIENMKAVGGNGGAAGSAGGGGGGGAGLGGGLFVASGGSVTLNNVNFTGNTAVGGEGGGPGAGGNSGEGGGGGGLGGGGGADGGGGGGVGASGASGGNGFPGAAGIIPGAAAGGTAPGGGAGGLGASGPGGASGGGGGSAIVFQGGAVFGAGGGVNGGSSAGGFGGGGGGGYVGDEGLAPHLTFFAGAGGAGGFGGGGGGGSGGGSSGSGGPANAPGGAGGFGGAGGGSGPPGAGVGTPTPGVSGFGAGTSTEGGGGGLGAGGDIFVQQGGSLTIEGGSLSGGTATGGTGGGNAGSGQGLGGGIFIQGNQTIDFAPAGGQTVTISDVIADQTGSGGAGSKGGVGNIEMTGSGTVVLSGANTYAGSTDINNGVVSIAADDNLGGDSGGALLEGGTLFLTASFTLEHRVAIVTAGSIDVAAGQTVTVANGIANASPIGQHGREPASLQVTGSGTLVLAGAGGSNLGVNLYAGTLVLGTVGAAGTGAITFEPNSNATLILDSGVDPANTISLPNSTDAIDFAGLPFAVGDHLVGMASPYTLETAGGATLATLDLGGAFSASNLIAGGDGAGGTEIAASYSAAGASGAEASIAGGSARILITDTAANFATFQAAIATLERRRQGGVGFHQQRCAERLVHDR